MRTTRLVSAVLFIFGLAGLAACSNTDTTSPTTTKDGETRTSGIALTSDTLADTDIAQMQFTVQGVNCETGEATGFEETKTKDFEDMMLPGGISKFEGAPLDDQSQHIFADAFFLVGAGCYGVQTTPLNEQGEPSADCETATRDRVSVEDGQTTEVLLVNQCKGAAKGGLDAVSAINHAPELENLEFQKFLSSCPAEGQQTNEARKVCATASDADGDGLEFVWSPLETGEVVGDIISTSKTQLDGNRVQSCAQLAINQKGQFRFRVNVFDVDAQGNRMEDILSEQQAEDVTSRDGLEFPIYSSVDCPAQQPEPKGRNVTMLMALSATDGGDVPWLIQNSVLWTSPIDNPEDSRVLYILDDNAGDQFLPADRQLVVNNLRNEGIQFNVDTLVEPEGGITFDQIDEYDVIWHQNPAQRIDDQQTIDALRQFQAQDGGLILQGQDIAAARIDGELTSLQQIHSLEFVNDGRRACGDRITLETDNEYEVSYTDEPLMVLDSLRGREFTYPSDIDRVRPTLTGEFVLANKSYSKGDCSVRAPAVSAIDPEAGQQQQ